MAEVFRAPSLLTPRQLELIALHASGYKITEIAKMKYLARVSVNRHIANAKERTGAKSTGNLIAWCMQAGLLELDSDGSVSVVTQDQRRAA